MKTSEGLWNLTRACVDDEQTLQHERKFVGTMEGKTLARLACEREQFASELERLGDRSKRRPSGSWAAIVREARRSLWVSAAGVNRGDAITSCCHSRARTEARYDAAMRWPWPEEIRIILAAQRRRIQDETDELNRLRF